MRSPISRVDYDPSNTFHRAALFQFLDTGKWSMHFKIELPYLELPAFLMRETLEYYRNKETTK